MRKLFKFLITAVMSIFNILFSTANAQSQEQSDYYYQGYTFTQIDGAKSASPYFTVVLIGGEDGMPKAVTMSNGIGDISFKGTPMNIYIQNKLEVYAGHKLIGVYLPKKWTERPPFPKGNMNAHMKVPSNLDFYTTKELVLPKESNVSLREFLSTTTDIEMDGEAFFVKGCDSSIRLFINNSSPAADKVGYLLDNLRTSHIKGCQLIIFKNPNKYFSGVLNITLVAGDPGSFPTDTEYINSLPLSK